MLTGVEVVFDQTKLKYQVSLFGDFSKYGANEDNLRKCFESFFKFQMMPGQVQEVSQMDGKVQMRISLQSVANGVSINLLTDRLDIMAIPLPGSPASNLTFEQFVDAGLPVAAELIKIFPAEIHRVGVVSESFMAPLAPEKLSTVRDRFLAPKLAYAADLPASEWNVRDVALGELVGVPSHFIYQLARVRAQITDMRGFKEQDTHHISIDVNSLPGQGALFKDFSTVQGYVGQALKMINKINSQIEERVNG